MPKQTYALERGGAKALEVSWKGVWKETEVRLNGQLIGTIPTQKELTAGQTFALPEGSSLTVQLVKTMFSAQLKVLRDGKPLPGSGSDPATRLAQSYGILYFVAGLNVVLGIIAAVFQVAFLDSIGFGPISIGIGLLFGLLGYLTQRRSLVALIIALLLYGLDSLFVLLSGFNAGIFVRIFFLYMMWQGIAAIKELKKETQLAVS